MKHEITHILKDAGLKITPIRLSILEQFSGECKPLNADQVFIKCKKGNTNLATVYRTLVSFENAGILRRIDLHKDSVFYELTQHHHHHIICTDCGSVESFEGCNIKSLTKNVLAHSSKFDSVTNHSLEFFGVCKLCTRD
jgi:Fe2+ or Zn2+ uptake regulation protein